MKTLPIELVMVPLACIGVSLLSLLQLWLESAISVALMRMQYMYFTAIARLAPVLKCVACQVRLGHVWNEID